MAVCLPGPGEAMLGVGNGLGLRERGEFSDLERGVRLHTGIYVHTMYRRPFRVRGMRISRTHGFTMPRSVRATNLSRRLGRRKAVGVEATTVSWAAVDSEVRGSGQARCRGLVLVSQLLVVVSSL